MRSLTTIGDLRTMRALERGARLFPFRTMGQTEANYIPPSLSQLDATPPGQSLTAATLAMLTHFKSGVPSEHVSDPYVMAFQKAYNADALSKASGGPGLAEDGGYGQNTHDTADVLTAYTGGGPVPPVNAGTAPAPAPAPPSPSPSPSPAPIVKHAGDGDLWVWGLALVVVGGLAYYIARRRRRRGGARRRAPSRAIILT
jgi:hypothetical protein